MPEGPWLSAGERQRIDGTGPARTRERFIARRWFVRQAIAEACGRAPTDLTIVQLCASCGGPHGRPRVWDLSGREVFASWSSLEDLTVVATASSPVGVDVAGDVGWARVEAALKATGHGLDVDPAQVELGPDRVRRWQGPGRRPVLRLASTPLPVGAVVAVACLGRRPVRPMVIGSPPAAQDAHSSHR